VDITLSIFLLLARIGIEGAGHEIGGPFYVEKCSRSI
jgi:hypothetical protein